METNTRKKNASLGSRSTIFHSGITEDSHAKEIDAVYTAVTLCLCNLHMNSKE